MLRAEHSDCCPAPAHGHSASLSLRLDCPQLVAGPGPLLPPAHAAGPPQLRHHALPPRHQLREVAQPAEQGHCEGQHERRPAPHLAGLHPDGPPVQRLHITLLSRREQSVS